MHGHDQQELFHVSLGSTPAEANAIVEKNDIVDTDEKRTFLLIEGDQLV